MSRIGLKPINLPAGVEIKVSDNNLVEVKGPKGQLSQQIDPEMIIKIEDGVLNVERPSEQKRHKSVHGLSRTLIWNMVEGVTEGYQKSLDIVGTGYRAAKQGNKLVLTLGYSHPIELEDPKGLEVEVPAQNKIIVKGIDKQQVGNFAAKIRDFRKPEPYKGKGIRYTDEYVRRKVGKTGK
ncbi:MAG: 50S ribosomal protein L6 [Gudongella sp.]|jgi:large subunit ribosomal protein L6|nr:50S ribosomal protein L6 [Gudongella sp.]